MITREGDFADWISPMIVKELRQGLRTRSFMTLFLLIQLGLSLVLSYYALDYASNPERFSPTGLNGWFWSLLGGVLLIGLPFRALSAVAREREDRTLELVYLTNLSALRIVAGKWACLLFEAGLLFLAVLPYVVVRYYFGGVNLTEEAQTLAWYLFLCALFCALGVAASVLPRWARGMLLFFSLPIGLSLLGYLLDRGSGGVGGLFGSSSTFELVQALSLILVAGAVAVMIALEIAANAIAPEAENHEGRLRGLVWLGLLIWLLAALWKMDSKWLGFFGVLGVIETTLVFALGLSSMRTPVRPQVEAWKKGGWLGRRLAWLFLPGWPSAVLHVLVTLTVAIVVGMRFFSSGSTERLGVWTFGFYLIATIMMSTLLTLPLRRLLPPLVMFVLLTVLLFLAGSFYGLMMHFAGENTQAMAFFPHSALTMLMNNKAESGDRLVYFTVGAFEAAGLLGVAFFLSRSYWHRVLNLEKSPGPQELPLG